MSWARLDDHANEHRKLHDAGHEAAWLWACGLMYANRQKARDGFIPEAMVALLYPFKAPKRLAAKLVQVKLWERAEGGYRIHDYRFWNKTKEQVQHDQAEGRRRAAESYARRKAEAEASAGSSQTSSAEESPKSEPKNSDSSGVEWSGGGLGAGDSDLETARELGPLQDRAMLWRKDPNLAALSKPNPENWPETKALVAKLKAVFGGAEQTPRHSSDPRMQLLFRHWAEGRPQSELEQAITGAGLNDHIRRNPDLQTLQTILKDSGAVDKYLRHLTVTPIAPVKANSRTVQPSQGENPYETAEVAT